MKNLRPVPPTLGQTDDFDSGVLAILGFAGSTEEFVFGIPEGYNYFAVQINYEGLANSDNSIKFSRSFDGVNFQDYADNEWGEGLTNSFNLDTLVGSEYTGTVIREFPVRVPKFLKVSLTVPADATDGTIQILGFGKK